MFVYMMPVLCISYQTREEIGRLVHLDRYYALRAKYKAEPFTDFLDKVRCLATG